MDRPALETVPQTPAEPTPTQPSAERLVEHGGRSSSVSKGLEPTRYGDWEKDGRCIDF